MNIIVIKMMITDPAQATIKKPLLGNKAIPKEKSIIFSSVCPANTLALKSVA